MAIPTMAASEAAINTDFSTQETPTVTIKGSPNSSIGSHHSSEQASLVENSRKIRRSSLESLNTGEILIEASARSTRSSQRSDNGSLCSARSGNTKGSNNSLESTSTTRNGYESFETFKFKVIKLCEDIGYGEPSEVEHMKGGSYNRIVGLKFASGQNRSCVLRIPVYDPRERSAIEVGNQVVVLHHFSKYEFLHVPSVLGYDLTKNNAIGSQYVLQSRLRGRTLEDAYYELPLSEKLEIVQLVAELLMKMESMSLPKPGRLVGKGHRPLVSHTPPTKDDIEIIGYRDNPMTDMPIVEKQHLKPFLIELFENQRHIYIEEEKEREEGPFLEPMFNKAQSMAVEMEAAGLMRTTDVENVAWHWDLSPRNIMIDLLSAESVEPEKEGYTVSGAGLKDSSDKSNGHTLEMSGDREGLNESIQQAIGATSSFSTNPPTLSECSTSSKTAGNKWTISGVLDWDDVISVPLVLARKPPTWLWCREDDRSTRYLREEGVDLDIQPARELNRDELLIKATFDQTMARYCPSYIEDTYHRGIWLRRLGWLAIYGVMRGNENWKLFESLRKDWDKYYKATGLKVRADCETDNGFWSNSDEDPGSESDEESVGEDDRSSDGD